MCKPVCSDWKRDPSGRTLPVDIAARITRTMKEYPRSFDSRSGKGIFVFDAAGKLEKVLSPARYSSAIMKRDSLRSLLKAVPSGSPLSVIHGSRAALAYNGLA